MGVILTETAGGTSPDGPTANQIPDSAFSPGSCLWGRGSLLVARLINLLFAHLES